ncbi:hypothetical protein EIB18_19385 [Caulobacter vibrioides]|uniref:Uncharacterized protein n=1 Tax=Caulobacter vibrioides (strain ATCC 19089 / CIP 103742 / CB 15) TaxID=190650 RepID=Q9A2A1_CAUVC|nr:hypothetical protein CC_3665 [Caulobacter vibrioides CB15]ATC26559.1 hypothetical protein CA608_19500 [Caulobacter vibrioides]ATC30466.1 hypothetical protein CA607_19650 [Caulobacter vibrioides]AZH14644.1 hypothetical protein EIB18_19385 [Caulobacter vibrioides]PLR12382.1 hypothetical protein CVUC_09130 [Caulobacter vibrioides]
MTGRAGGAGQDPVRSLSTLLLSWPNRAGDRPKQGRFTAERGRLVAGRPITREKARAVGVVRAGSSRGGDIGLSADRPMIWGAGGAVQDPGPQGLRSADIDLIDPQTGGRRTELRSYRGVA